MQSWYSSQSANKSLYIEKKQPTKVVQKEIIQIELIEDPSNPVLIVGEKIYDLSQLEEQKRQDVIKAFKLEEKKLRELYNSQLDLKTAKITSLKIMAGIEFIAKKLPEENCPICICPLFDLSTPLSELVTQMVLGLDCEHFYHGECLDQCLKENHIQCPICNRIFGVKTGDQPEGVMEVQYSDQYHCAGYEKCGVIMITYKMYNGVRNGKPFNGTQRQAFLPRNAEGEEVLKLLRLAFERKLIFSVGRSVTTGKDNQTVWAGIHHKTSLTGGSANFGYPDATYFQRVKEELASKGIV